MLQALCSLKKGEKQLFQLPCYMDPTLGQLFTFILCSFKINVNIITATLYS